MPGAPTGGGAADGRARRARAQILRELKMQKAQMLIELQRAENRHLAARREQARLALLQHTLL